MIHDVDESLRRMIDAEVTNGGGVEVSFDAPTKDWSSRRNVPTIDVFLYDIREDLGRRDLGPQVVRDDRGIVIDRQPPPRRFKLSYLLTAWTQRAEDEHRLLSALLSLFLRYDAVPDEHLVGTLAEFRLPTLFSLALPPGPDRSLSDIWSALGGELKPSLDLQVVVPFDPRRHFVTGPPTLEAPRIQLGPDDAGTGDGGGTRRAKAAAVADAPGTERIQVGTDSAPGRTLTIGPRRAPGPGGTEPPAPA